MESLLGGSVCGNVAIVAPIGYGLKPPAARSGQIGAVQAADKIAGH